MDELARMRGRSERTHLRREIRTALELAIVALAKVVEPLASAAGLLEALEELPEDTRPVRELGESIRNRATEALGAWQAWRAHRIPEPA